MSYIYVPLHRTSGRIAGVPNIVKELPEVVEQDGENFWYQDLPRDEDEALSVVESFWNMYQADMLGVQVY